MKIQRYEYLAAGVLFALVAALGSNGQAQLRPNNPGWNTVDFQFFTVSTPKDLEPQESLNEDSSIWRFKNDRLLLVVDLGIYASKPPYPHLPSYRERVGKIDDKVVSIVSYKNDNAVTREYRAIVAAYFPKIDSQNSKLSLVAFCKKWKDVETAMKILQSVRFKSGNAGLDLR